MDWQTDRVNTDLVALANYQYTWETKETRDIASLAMALIRWSRHYQYFYKLNALAMPLLSSNK
jgi:hypothetical protein